MTFLPIVARELRVASRRRSTYWFRTGAALAMIAAGTWLFLMLQREPPRELGASLFCVLTAGAVLSASLSGVRSTADCLSEEKREGTLGLLFLTDLKGYDVVFGKLVATSVNAFYGILAMVPMLAIPLLMGGVTLAEFGRMALVAVNCLLFSLALGMCVSASTRSAQKAMAATLFLLLLLGAVLPGLGAMLAALGKTRRVELFFLISSPGYAYYLALDSAYKTLQSQFWYSQLVIHGLTWLCLAVASVIVPRSWQDKVVGGQSMRWRELWQLWSFGALAERTAFRRRLLEINPFFWLASRIRIRPALVWAFLGLVACCWLWGVAKFRREWLNDGVYVTTAIVLNLVLRCWFAGESTRQLGEERKAGALELLLSTPLTVPEILQGVRLSLVRQFLGPVIAVLLLECIFLWTILRESLASGERTFIVELWVAGMAMFIADLCALYWVGMWQGLVARNPARAASGSLSRVLVVPWLLIAMVMLFLGLASMRGMREPEPFPNFFLGLWFVLGLLVDFGFAAYARQKLLTEFRIAAQQRYDLQKSFWQRLFAQAPADEQKAQIIIGPARPG